MIDDLPNIANIENEQMAKGEWLRLAPSVYSEAFVSTAEMPFKISGYGPSGQRRKPSHQTTLKGGLHIGGVPHPAVGRYRGKHTRGIVIEGIRFEGRGITTTDAHERVMIRDCVFVDCDRAINFGNAHGGRLSGWTIENCQMASCGIGIDAHEKTGGDFGHLSIYWTDMQNVEVPFALNDMQHVEIANCRIQGRYHGSHFRNVEGEIRRTRFESKLQNAMDEYVACIMDIRGCHLNNGRFDVHGGKVSVRNSHVMAGGTHCDGDYGDHRDSTSKAGPPTKGKSQRGQYWTDIDGKRWTCTKSGRNSGNQDRSKWS